MLMEQIQFIGPRQLPEGSYKIGSARPSFRLSGRFLGMMSLCQCHGKVCVTKPNFLVKIFCPKNWENGPKMSQNGFFNLFEIWSLMFTEFDENENEI